MIRRWVFLRFSIWPTALLLLITFTGSRALGQGYGGHLPPNHINPHGLSQGGQAWWFGPDFSGITKATLSPAITGGNVDAANTNEDLAAGQSETAIAASGNLVMAAWNDATGFFISPSTEPQASLTGVGFSGDGGNSFHDLRGLPNNNLNQKWFGDPSVVAVDNGRFFIVGSIYASIFPYYCSQGPAQNAIAVSVASVTSTGIRFTNPIVVASGGDACSPPGQTAFLDKDFLSYDPSTRRLVVIYTQFTLFG